MAKAEIHAGICGYTTVVQTAATDDPQRVTVTIESSCSAIQRLAQNLTEVNPFQEFSFRKEGPLTLKMAAQYCSHAACPVPAGIIKAIEIAAGLALPADVSIKVSKTDGE
jgi:hypothetical protein